MERLKVSTEVYLPPADVYEFLCDFPRYAHYSSYLDRVEAHGDGSPGTEYRLVFEWWKLSYTAHSRVVDVDPPNRIDWRIVKDIEASGAWEVEPIDTGENMSASDEPSGNESASSDPGPGKTVPDGSVDQHSQVYFIVQFDTSTARHDAIDIPRYVSFDWVLDRLKPKLMSEAEQVVKRIVADLEGRPRKVELDVHETPSL